MSVYDATVRSQVDTLRIRSLAFIFPRTSTATCTIHDAASRKARSIRAVHLASSL